MVQKKLTRRKNKMSRIEDLEIEITRLLGDNEQLTKKLAEANETLMNNSMQLEMLKAQNQALKDFIVELALARKLQIWH